MCRPRSFANRLWSHETFFLFRKPLIRILVLKSEVTIEVFVSFPWLQNICPDNCTLYATTNYFNIIHSLLFTFVSWFKAISSTELAKNSESFKDEFVPNNIAFAWEWLETGFGLMTRFVAEFIAKIRYALKSAISLCHTNTVICTVPSSSPLLGSGLQRRTFPFPWIREISLASATSV
jgi:hypothetical protein